MIDKEAPLPVTKQCQLLRVNRSSVYYQEAAVSDEELAIMRQIDEIHLARPFLGSRRIADELKDRGFTVNRKRVQRLMGLMGSAAIYPKPSTSKAAGGHKICPYLLRDLEPEWPNQVWVADITYLPMAKGFAYLVAIMDLYSKILGWRLSNSLDPRFCTAALEEALTQYSAPDIFNTDQGAQFTAQAFTGVLEQHGVRISMDGKGRWIDNVFIERFWKSLKYEEVYLYAYSGLSDARPRLDHYIRYYNRERRHSSLGKQTPDEVYYGATSTQLLPVSPTSGSRALTPRPCSCTELRTNGFLS
jgi:putative transposase